MQLHSTIWKEGKVYIIKEAYTGVTTQGRTIEDAVENMKEAVQVYLEELPEIRKELRNIKTVGAVSVEIA